MEVQRSFRLVEVLGVSRENYSKVWLNVQLCKEVYGLEWGGWLCSFVALHQGSTIFTRLKHSEASPLEIVLYDVVFYDYTLHEEITAERVTICQD